MEQQDLIGASPPAEPGKKYVIRYRLETFTVQDSGAAAGKSFPNGTPLTSSEATAALARGIYATLDADKEHFVLFALNQKHRVTGFKIISTGSLTASLVHPREVFTAALELRAAALIFVHNHPSGDPAPSPEDITLTKRLKEGADILGLRALDHIIIGDGNFFSFCDKGML